MVRNEVIVITGVPRSPSDQITPAGRVLDLANLTMLNTSYVAATSQLHTAKARLAASQPAFERAQSLYERNIGSLAQRRKPQRQPCGRIRQPSTPRSRKYAH